MRARKVTICDESFGDEEIGELMQRMVELLIRNQSEMTEPINRASENIATEKPTDTEHGQ